MAGFKFDFLANFNISGVYDFLVCDLWYENENFF